MPLATIFVEIFLKEKNWGGFRPYLVTLWKEFEISLKKTAFSKFSNESTVQVNLVVHALINDTGDTFSTKGSKNS